MWRHDSKAAGDTTNEQATLDCFLQNMLAQVAHVNNVLDWQHSCDQTKMYFEIWLFTSIWVWLALNLATFYFRQRHEAEETNFDNILTHMKLQWSQHTDVIAVLSLKHESPNPNPENWCEGLKKNSRFGISLLNVIIVVHALMTEWLISNPPAIKR